MAFNTGHIAHGSAVIHPITDYFPGGASKLNGFSSLVNKIAFQNKSTSGADLLIGDLTSGIGDGIPLKAGDFQEFQAGDRSNGIDVRSFTVQIGAGAGSVDFFIHVLKV